MGGVVALQRQLAAVHLNLAPSEHQPGARQAVAVAVRANSHNPPIYDVLQDIRSCCCQGEIFALVLASSIVALELGAVNENSTCKQLHLPWQGTPAICKDVAALRPKVAMSKNEHLSIEIKQ